MKRTNVPYKEQPLIDETNMQRLLNVFFLHPEIEFSLTEVAQKAGIAKSAASRILPELEELNIITIKKLGPVLRIQADRGSAQFLKRKIAWNLSLIYHTTMVDFLDEHFQRPKAIVLFGSFRNGKDQTDSDIDIAIETGENTEMQTLRLAELVELENLIQRPIQIHLFNRKNIDPNVFASIANGIVLWGFLEAKP